MLDPLSTLFEDMYLKLFLKPRFVTLNGYAYTTMQWDFDGPQDRPMPGGNQGQTDERELEVRAHAEHDAALFAESLDEEDSRYSRDAPMTDRLGLVKRSDLSALSD